MKFDIIYCNLQPVREQKQRYKDLRITFVSYFIVYCNVSQTNVEYVKFGIRYCNLQSVREQKQRYKDHKITLLSYLIAQIQFFQSLKYIS